MSEFHHLHLRFRPCEIKVLRDAYTLALSYLDAALGGSDRQTLAQLVLVAGAARRRSGLGLNNCVDAHILSVDVSEVFSALQDLELLNDLDDVEARVSPYRQGLTIKYMISSEIAPLAWQPENLHAIRKG